MPFVRRGITFPTQQAYRDFLAVERGFLGGRSQMDRAIAAEKRRLAHELQDLPAPQQGRVAAEMASFRQMQRQGLGPFVEGVPQHQRLPQDLLNLLQSLPPSSRYPLWKTLYARR